MKDVTIVFPHQLFKENAAIQPGRTCYLIEELLFFSQYHFHKQKLVLHRAGMKAYEVFLSAQNIPVEYIDAVDELADIRKLLGWLADSNVGHIHYIDPVDDWLTKRIKKSCLTHSLQQTVYQSPSFLNSMMEADAYFSNKTNYFQTAFYIAERKRRNILTDAAGEPAGGRWSYDADNRLKFPQGLQAPVVRYPGDNTFTQEAIIYVENNFSHHYGTTTTFRYPINFSEAENWLDDFIENRFQKFGIYEDAIVSNEHYLHHSVLSPLLNTGLLTPQQVLDKILLGANNYNIPLNSMEGFIRQIVGWREFIRIVYAREGNRQRTKNFWAFSRKIPLSFRTGNTGIIPIDNTIKKILGTGYCHHIERLMLLGNFMLLCEFDPDEVYLWFMEMFIDSYDWVMVPNVYGMTQFADGGLMTTKPYISSSNYILKMSDYKKGGWCAVWDGLFWRFMSVHRNFFEGNQRLAMLLKTLDKMSDEKRMHHFDTAEKFLASL